MRESEFIEQNKKNWQELDALESSQKDPERTSELFIEVTNDLSYSKSYYPNRSIRIYLNNLALSVHSEIYRTRHSTLRRLKEMWLDTIPRVYYEARKSVYAAAIIFTASLLIGVFSSAQDPGFASVMLSQDYVEMTLDNIEKGEPMAVYGTMAEMDMFIYITFNNIYVAFRVFLFGLFFMIGTIASMIFEGTRLGAFHHLFYEYGVLKESLLAVWMHGMPEICSIILAGGAGLELGKGLVFPGTYLRKEAFFIGAKRGMLMMLGIIPVFILAGFVEAFITRHTDVNDVVRAIYIMINAGFIATYFLIMPIIRYRHKTQGSVVEESLPESRAHDFKMKRVKTTAMLFSDTFSKYSREFIALIWPIFLTALTYVAIFFVYLGNKSSEYFKLPMDIDGGLDFFVAISRSFLKIGQLYRYQEDPILFLLNSISVAVVVFLALRTIIRQKDLSRYISNEFSSLKLFLSSLLFSSAVHVLFFVLGELRVLLLIGIIPTITYFFVSRLAPSIIMKLPLQELLSALFQSLFKLTWLFFLLIGCSILFLIFFNSGLTDYLFQILLSNLGLSQEAFNIGMLAINTGFTIFGLFMVIPLFIFASFFSFWSSHEKQTAMHLKEIVANIGTRSRAYGMLREEG